MSEAAPLIRGSVAWADLSLTQGREQAGRRPVVVVASRGYLSTITALAIVLPVTTVDRGLPNHVPLRGSPGLGRPSWAMTEQVRTNRAGPDQRRRRRAGRRHACRHRHLPGRLPRPMPRTARVSIPTARRATQQRRGTWRQVVGSARGRRFGAAVSHRRDDLRSAALPPRPGPRLTSGVLVSPNPPRSGVRRP